MKKLLVLGSALAAVLAGTLVAPAAAQTATPSQSAPSRAGYTPPALTFAPCADPALAARKLECGTLVVPLDYAKPKGAKIKIAVSRLKHRSSAKDYQGVMLVNPGGPGGSGLGLAVLGRGDIVPGTGDDDYDWIGFDPRGVGSSRPALSCDPGYTGYDRPPYVPTTQAKENAWLRKAAGYASDCRYSDAKRLLPHLKTTDNVADMESLRKALGQQRINYYGFSYGTYLGQVYATQHPTRVRRLVFDGTVDPSRVWYQSNFDQDRAFEITINKWFAWLAANDDVYGLGDSAAEVSAAYYAQLKKLEATPFAGKLGPSELNDILLSAGYYVFDWDVLGHAFSDLVNRGDGTALLEQYAVPGTPQADNGNAMYLATVCTDAKWPQNFDRIRTDNWRVAADAPFETWANAWFNGPCLGWPAKSGKPVDVDGSDVTPKVLMISETLDPATPYSGSLEVRKRFPTASLIEGVGGTTHSGSLSGVACTDDTIGAYLKTGVVPKRVAGNRSDKQCDPVPPPDPTPAAGAPSTKLAPATQGDRLVRQLLEAAQVR